MLRRYEQELGLLRIDWRPFSPQKVRYDLDPETTPVPISLDGRLRTKVLDAEHKARFVYTTSAPARPVLRS